MVGRTPVGETASLEVLRGGEVIQLSVEIGKLPDQGAELASAPDAAQPGAGVAPLGLEVDPLPAKLADSLNIEGGVVVTNVARGAAFDAGIRPRDVITEIDRKKVRSVDDFRAIVSKLDDGKAVSVRVVREGRALYLVMKP